MAKKEVDTISGTDVLQAPQSTERRSSNALGLTEATSRIFRLSNDKRKGTVILNMEEDVIDPETNKIRRMRLLRGAQTLWFDEQPPTVFPKSYVDTNLETLTFDKGDCVISIHDPLKIKAAELTFRNVANRKKYGARAKAKDIYFYEWNPTEISKQAAEEDDRIMKAMQLAYTVPIEEVIPHAKYLNIPFEDEMGVPLEPDALRTAYARYAKSNATKFLNSIHSPIVKTAFLIKKAIDTGLIDLGKQRGAAYWTDGGFITALPEGRDAVEYLIEFAQVYGEAGAAFASQLRELTS